MEDIIYGLWLSISAGVNNGQIKEVLDLFENFILYDHSGGYTAKILARNHQYLGVNEAMKAYADRKLNDGKLGVFWHTQGSGKTALSAFSNKVIRDYYSAKNTRHF